MWKNVIGGGYFVMYVIFEEDLKALFYLIYD